MQEESNKSPGDSKIVCHAMFVFSSSHWVAKLMKCIFCSPKEAKNQAPAPTGFVEV
jgi:hypothetical protein